MVKMFDAATAAFKTYALLTPGFHTRNFFGGMFNNYLAGVDSTLVGSTRPLFHTFHSNLNDGVQLGGRQNIDRALKAVEASNADPRMKEAFIEGVRMGVIGSDRNATSEIRELQRIASGGRSNPLIDNRLTDASGRTGDRVESNVRGLLFIDRMLKDGDRLAALDDVAKYHFDYDDLSTFERSAIRRVIPFYTWSRKNLPLQVEGMLTNPKAYNRFAHVKRNIELGQEEEAVLPQYVQEALHIPFDIPGTEGTDFIMPDLPFKDLTRTVDPGQIFGSTNPLLRTPLELKFGKKSFNNIPFRPDRPNKVPTTWVGIGPVLDQLGFAEKVGDDYYTQDKHLYVLEANLPLLARLRRAAPSDDETEDALRDRRTTSWVNYVLGAGLFTNTERAQRGEEFRRRLEGQDEEKFQQATAALQG